MSEKTVTHSGTVQEIKNGKAFISVMTKSACVSCEIKGSCTLSDVKEKIIEVELKEGQKFEKGKAVNVEMKQTTGTWAVLLGYFFPFLLVLGGLIVFTVSGLNQGLAGLLSLALLIPYYLTLYFFRTTIRKRFTFRIE
ncbi:MAG: SoxR reducing system RseC family protein [Bacteroidales bacterium]|nr:SoxR reducing system RseC family protein [Bacteroidales bacterium]